MKLPMHLLLQLRLHSADGVSDWEPEAPTEGKA
jgi:hypothetical protein